VSICNRNRIMTGLRLLFRVTLRRLDLAGDIYHLREPQKIPLVMSPDETRRLLAVASNLKVRTLLSLGYGGGLRAIEVVRLKVKHIDSSQKIIRIEQSQSLPSRKRGAARTATSCCRQRRSIYCANGGKSVHRVTMPEPSWRNAGCFLATDAAI
jgi:integrase